MDVSLDTFKAKLDKFLTLIPESPRFDARSRLYSNELDVVVKKLQREQHFHTFNDYVHARFFISLP